MFNKKKGSKKILKRVLALLMVLMFTTTSMPVFGLDVWDDQPDNGNDIYFASSGEYGDSEFEPEAGYGDDYEQMSWAMIMVMTMVITMKIKRLITDTKQITITKIKTNMNRKSTATRKKRR